MRGSPAAAAIFLPVLLFFLGAPTVGCQDYEQRARALGREAHRDADRACPEGPGEADDAAAVTFSVDACRVHACEASCGKAGAASFQRICADVCAARGGCDRDEDCDPALRCVAVAPVLRRCVKSAGDAGR